MVPATPASGVHVEGEVPQTPMSMSQLSAGTMTAGEAEKHVIWGTDISVRDTMDRFRAFLRGFRVEDADAGVEDASPPLYEDRLRLMALTDRTDFCVDCEHMYSFPESRKVYLELVRFPQEVVPLMDMVANEEFDRVVSELRAVGELEAEGEGEAPRERLQVRTYNLLEQRQMRALGPTDIDQLVSVRGMVIRSTGVIPDLKVGFFKCATCGAEREVLVDRGRVQEPTTCESCQSKFSFEIVHNRCLYADKQVVKMQETPDGVPEGETPHTLTLYAFESLVDVAKPGDRVEVTGIFRAVPMRENPRMRRLRAVYRTYVDVLHVRKLDSSRLRAEDAGAAESSEYFTTFEEEVRVEGEDARLRERMAAMGQDPEVYEKLTRSLAPSIWEMDDVKKGVLCMLAGGTNKGAESQAAGKVRGEVNVLLCGDPGTSKSQLLGFVHKLAPRGIYTSGKGSSAVGLTAYVTKDPDTRELVLESGALVLSDRGVCCIDEFDKMSDATRSVLHEAMEQQTISVAKAGIICTLNARTSILASANPVESRYNPNLSVVENLQLPPSLLSRFDLIFLILDVPAPAYDRRLAQHLVSLYLPDELRAGSAQPYTQRQVAEYLSFVRQHLSPRISDEAAEQLVQTYVDMRAEGYRAGAALGRKVIAATPRQLESLIRLAEAHAKLRFSPIVEVDDVVEAKRLMDTATMRAAMDKATGTINMGQLASGFSAEAVAAASDLGDTILDALSRARSGLSLRQLQDKITQDRALTATELQSALKVMADTKQIQHRGERYFAVR